MIADDAAREAVETLGLLKVEAMQTIARLLDGTMSEHPRTITTRYRKEGEQITDVEKKALGIRKNGFLSIAARDEITELGLTDPLTVHEITLLRASFTVSRSMRVQQWIELSEALGKQFVGFKHETLHRDCPACNQLSDLATDEGHVHIIPPSNCAPRCTANYSIGYKIDWLAGIE